MLILYLGGIHMENLIELANPMPGVTSDHREEPSHEPLRSEPAAYEGCLSAQEIECLTGIRSGDIILCTYGVLWITQTGDPQDYLLNKGEKFVANRCGLVLIQALVDSACRCYTSYRKGYL
jgi:hypothetical protein